MNKIELEVQEVLRCSSVNRWIMVNVSREQSVAEHSFNVAIIAARIAEEVNPDLKPHVMAAAILHDIPEVITGDIPTPVKELLVEKYEDLESGVSYCGMGLNKSVMVYDIVKRADIIDAGVFLHLHGVGTHAKDIHSNILARIKKCEISEKVYWDILSGRQRVITDFIGEQNVSDKEEPISPRAAIS